MDLKPYGAHRHPSKNLKLSLAVKRNEGKCNGKSSGTTGRV
jgi:hypothetical protein